MNDITKLIAAAVVLKKDSEVSLLDVPAPLLPGRTGLKNAALAQYGQTMDALKKVVGKVAGALFVFGPGAKSFSEVAEDEGPALTLDASAMYASIARAWYPTVRVDKVFALDCLMSFLGGVNEVLPALGIQRIRPPEFGQFFGRPVRSFDDAVALSRDIMRSAVGDDLNVMFLTAALAEKVVTEDWDLDIIPVVVVNATLDEVSAKDGLGAALFFGKNDIIETKNTTVEKNEVLIAFRSLMARVSPSKVKAPKKAEPKPQPVTPPAETTTNTTATTPETTP